MTEVITRVAGDDSKSVALEGTARCAVLPSTDNMSRLSSINILFAGPCFPGQKKKKGKTQKNVRALFPSLFLISKSLAWLKLVGVEP